MDDTFGNRGPCPSAAPPASHPSCRGDLNPATLLSSGPAPIIASSPPPTSLQRQVQYANWMQIGQSSCVPTPSPPPRPHAHTHPAIPFSANKSSSAVLRLDTLERNQPPWPPSNGLFAYSFVFSRWVAGAPCGGEEEGGGGVQLLPPDSQVDF